jgi:hypothetical protein
MIDETALREILVGQLEVLHEVRVHLFTIKKVLRDKGLVSDEDYVLLMRQVDQELRREDQEVIELNRILGLGSSSASEAP